MKNTLKNKTNKVVGVAYRHRGKIAATGTFVFMFACNRYANQTMRDFIETNGLAQEYTNYLTTKN